MGNVTMHGQIGALGFSHSRDKGFATGVRTACTGQARNEHVSGVGNTAGGASYSSVL